MAVRKYTKDQADELVGGWRRVEALWLNPAIEDYILLDEELIRLLAQFEVHFDGQVRFATRNSLFRTKETNRTAGGASRSKHMQGIAADFYIDGVTPLALAQYAEVCGAGGIGVYSDRTRHIHMDTRSGKTRWWKITSASHTPGFGGVPVTFREGHRSKAIELLQARLNVDGFAAGVADGIFGKRTRDALRRWQAEHGLEADGVFGRKTNEAMLLFDWAPLP